jgi:hypothetical protein
MAKHFGGSPAQSGYYWSPRHWSVTPVPRQGGILPGDPGDTYVKIPLVAAILLAPILGGLFVVFLPFIGFALFLHAVARKLLGAVRKGAAHLAATMSPGWRPGEAHLTGKRGGLEDHEVPAKSEAMEKLAKEIQEKREEGEGQ